jgi:putative transposase
MGYPGTGGHTDAHNPQTERSSCGKSEEWHWGFCSFVKLVSVRGGHSNSLKPSRRRELVRELACRYGASQRQACSVMMLSRSVYYYRTHARGAEALQMRIKEIAHTRVHYGYRRVQQRSHSQG